jgi:hypothetical protein
MTEYAPAKEGKSDLLREEDPADLGVDIGEGIANASDDEILKRRSSLHK